MMELSNKNRSLKQGISKVTSPTPPKEGLKNEQSKGVINEDNTKITQKMKLRNEQQKEQANSNTIKNTQKNSTVKKSQNILPTKNQDEIVPPLERTEEAKPGYITADPTSYITIKKNRDRLKKNPTKAEKIMWEYYRNKKTGHKIRRQHIIEKFIPDFVCLTKKIVIEIDGKIHLKQKEYDTLRTKRLNELGYRVIRFTNEEVYANPQLVAQKTKEILDATPTPPKQSY